MVREEVERFVAETAADEVMAVGSIFDPSVRARSFEILMETVGRAAAPA